MASHMLSRRAFVAGALAPLCLTGAEPARTHNIRDFGATGDGKTLDTAAVQKAIDACTAAGGGTVLVPPGDFVVGTVELKSNVALHLAASGRLLGSGNPADYSAG